MSKQITIQGVSIPFEDSITGLEALKAFEEVAGIRSEPVVALKEGQALYDLRWPISQSKALDFVGPQSPEALEILRHDIAHIMGQAVQELYPGTQVVIGPTIEDGFYYDFLPKKPFTPEDVEAIEARMHMIVDRKQEITYEVWERAKALDFFQKQGEVFKTYLIQDIPSESPITVYHQGDFSDLCRGPHGPHTGWVGHHFKLTKVSGAYWRGDSKNTMLQRIYGTAWLTREGLEDYMDRQQRAQDWDHKKLGQRLSLFHFQEEAPGDVFWHPNGWFVYRQIQSYIRKKLAKDYQEIKTPGLVDLKLWETSGHWEKFQENMMISQVEGKTFALKPMNCPCHVEVFKQGPKSYRDLPFRLSEFGSCTRYEPSGALKGLMRLRNFTQDDAHIFCRPDQIYDETQKFCDLLQAAYRDFGFHEIAVKFSDRPEKRAGSDELWDRAEAALKRGAHQAGLSYELNPGEGAFYGPKLEFVLKDALGRSWQCGTIQVDFVLPQRLGAFYGEKDGSRQNPVILHRAILGSFERFLGILLEHYGGKLPLWLVPYHVYIATVTEDQRSYGEEVAKTLENRGIRVYKNFSSGRIGEKIKDMHQKHIPYGLILGKKEEAHKKVSFRHRNETDLLEISPAIDRIEQDIKATSPKDF